MNDDFLTTWIALTPERDKRLPPPSRWFWLALGVLVILWAINAALR
jgi:hypothetical protein